MKPGFLRHDNRRTAYIQLDTGNCRACWKCSEICPNHVIGRVNVLWHKHAKIITGDNCTGCLKCVSVCEFNALNSISL